MFAFIKRNKSNAKFLALQKPLSYIHFIHTVQVCHVHVLNHGHFNDIVSALAILWFSMGTLVSSTNKCDLVTLTEKIIYRNVRIYQTK
jgi:hypothetical protein